MFLSSVAQKDNLQEKIAYNFDGASPAKKMGGPRLSRPRKEVNKNEFRKQYSP